MTQQERLAWLVQAFKEDSGTYRNWQTGSDPQEQRRALRSLMNIRPPKPMANDVLEMQDAYLRERIAENGIVQPADLAPCASDPRLILWQGDITRLAADAIMNAANAEMLGCFVPMHTCIDNCIHTFAGVQMRLECDRQMRALRARYGQDYEQPTAVPILTGGFNLPAKKVVHIVGPIVSGRLTKAQEQALADCYVNTLDLCAENELKTVAFCCLSTGVFRFPKRRAAEIAVETVQSWLDAHPKAGITAIFNVFGDEDRRIYEQLLN